MPKEPSFHPLENKSINHISSQTTKCLVKIKNAIPEEMEAKRNASGCRFGATGSYGDESSMSPPETTVKMSKTHYHSS